MELNWRISELTSCLHSLAEIARGRRLVDQPLAQLLTGPAELLCEEIVGLDLSFDEFLGQLVPLSLRIENVAELARTAVARLVGNERAAGLAPPIARLIQDAVAMQRRDRPEALDQLELRAKPIFEQWEARGPGLLSAIGRLTEPALLVGEAEVAPVLPVLGGDGAAHWPHNVVTIEAVLANPFPELPEVVRLGWLLAQLNLDLPRFQGGLTRQRLAEIGPFSLLPAVLDAAEMTELGRGGEAAVARAAELWRLRPIDTAMLWSWWETYCESRPAWPQALAALDQLLASSNNTDEPERDI